MTPSTTVPLTITPDATAYIEQLGTRAEFEQMIDYIRQHVSGLRSLEVEIQPPYDTGNEDQVIIHALRDAAVADPNDPTKWEWHRWVIATFPTDVYLHYTLMFAYGDNDVG
jgi:hypothetical protein